MSKKSLHTYYLYIFFRSGLVSWAVGAQENYFGKNLTGLEPLKTLNIEQEILRHTSITKTLMRPKLPFKKCAVIHSAARRKG